MSEAFLYQDVRVFNPHYSIAELSMPAQVLAVEEPEDQA